MEETGPFKTAYQGCNCYLHNVYLVMREHIEEKQLVGLGRKCPAVPLN